MAAATWLVLVPWTYLTRSRAEVDARLGRAGGGRDSEPASGGTSGAATSPSRIVIHGVSVGEITAAAELARHLAESPKSGPRAPAILLTVGTTEGLERAHQLAAELAADGIVVAVGWLPWDRPRALRQWLRRLDVCGLVLVEGELWPGLLAAAQGLGIPVLLASGRVYPRDVGAYRLIAWAFAPLLASLRLVAAQSLAEAGRFAAIGVPRQRLVVAGDLKADRAARLAAARDRATSKAEVVLAASTHAPEEAWLLAALPALRQTAPDVRLVLAPRHPRRAGALALQAAHRGWRTVVGAAPPADERWDVLVVDRLGCLDDLYDRAAVVVVGGSLARRGGHDPLAAASRGCALVVGPHVGHVRDAVDRLRRAGGLLTVDDVACLTATLADLLADPERARRLGTAARQAVADGHDSGGLIARALRAVTTGSSSPAD